MHATEIYYRQHEQPGDCCNDNRRLTGLKEGQKTSLGNRKPKKLKAGSRAGDAEIFWYPGKPSR